MAEETPRPVGWFVDKGQLVTILPEEGQSAVDAIKEETSDRDVTPDQVIKGEPPDDWEKKWEEKHPPADKAEAKKDEEKGKVVEEGKKKPNPPSDDEPDVIQPKLDLKDEEAEEAPKEPKVTAPQPKSIDWAGMSNDLLSSIWRG